MILGVLLLLLGVIGLERGGSLQRILHGDGLTARGDDRNHPAELTQTTPQTQPTPATPPTINPARRLSGFGTSSLRGGAIDQDPHPGAAPQPEPSAERLPLNGLGSPFHVISSRSILGTDHATDEQIARLRRATETVLSPLPHGIAVFDLDTAGRFDSPILLYNRNGFDLTPRVKQAYDRLTQDEVEFVPAPNLGDPQRPSATRR